MIKLGTFFKKGVSVFKNSIIIAFVIFVFLIVKQLIFNDEISWVNNIGISVAIFLVYNFWEWAKKPYNWKKNKKEKQ